MKPTGRLGARMDKSMILHFSIKTTSEASPKDLYFSMEGKNNIYIYIYKKILG